MFSVYHMFDETPIRGKLSYDALKFVNGEHKEGCSHVINQNQRTMTVEVNIEIYA